MMTVLGEYVNLVPWWAVIIVGVITLVYEYLTWNFGYWKKLGVKGDNPRILLGTFPSLFNVKPLELIDQEMYKKYGRICGAFEGRQPSLIVGDPELLRLIFVKDFHAFCNRRRFNDGDGEILNKGLFQLRNEEWKVLRNVTVPSFSTGKLKQMVPLIEECAEQLINHLEKFADSGESFECKKWLSSFSLDVIATCAFGIKIDSIRDQNSKFVKAAKSTFEEVSWYFIFYLILPNFMTKFLPTISSKESCAYLSQVVQNVITARKREAKPRRDFLQLLLEAKEEAEKELEENDVSEEKSNIAAIKRKVLAPDYICAQSVLALTAGFETATLSILFALYYLATNEDIQEKVFQEIDEVLFKKNKNKFAYDVMNEMHYLDMVISEVLRMAPPIQRLERICTADDYVLDGIPLKRGDNIFIPVYAMHYDEEFYPNPTVFDPERFSQESKNNRDPLTYLPFGYGPRNCIGFRFALMEVKIALIYLLKEYRIKTCPETEVPFTRKLRSFFFEPTSTMLRLEKRTTP